MLKRQPVRRLARRFVHLLCAVLLLSASAPLLAAAEISDEQVEALHDAARSGDLGPVRTLLEAGVPVDAGNDYEVTALLYAAGWGHADVVRLLLEHGAEIGHVDNLYGANAMTWATDRGHRAVIALLVEHGADAAAAIHSAISNGDVGTVEILLSTDKLSPEILTAALSQAVLEEGEGVEKIRAALETAGAQRPEPTGYEAAPETLASSAGVYGFVDVPAFTLELKLEDGRLVAQVAGENPIVLEAVADDHFRQDRGTFVELRMKRTDGVVEHVELHQVNSPRSFRFLRQEETAEATPAEPTAPTATTTSAEAREKTAPPEETTAKIPQGVADRNWTGFRGPATAGTAKGSPPVEWNVEDGTNILWKTAIPGRSHASPIVWGDKVFLATAISSAEEAPFRTGNYGDPDFVETEATYTWRLLALDRSTGEILWDRKLHEGKPRAKHHIKASQWNATPTTDGRRIVAVVGSEGLFCYDLDGNLLWKKDLGKLAVGWFYDEGFEWGHSASPILHGDRVILQVDRSKDPFIAAYALADGRELWRTERDNLPSWGTPAIVEGPKGPEIVTNGSRKIRGYDPATGRELWNLGPHSEVTVGSVVTGHGLTFAVGNWRPIRAIYAIRPGGRGDISLPEGETSSAHIAWHHARGGTYVPTPLVYGDVFYTLAGSGVLRGYNITTGEKIAEGRVAARGGEAFSASPIAASGRLYVASEDGDVYVVRHGTELEPLAKNTMDEIIMATPAVSGDLLIVRTLENVYAIGAPTPP